MIQHIIFRCDALLTCENVVQTMIVMPSTPRRWGRGATQSCASLGLCVPGRLHIPASHINVVLPREHRPNLNHRHELLPAVEERFRGIGEGWARFTYGGSTGGWEALAVQLMYPDDLNGCYAACPDSISFEA